MRPPRLALLVLVALAGAALARAQAPDPLLAVHSADPLELARVVDRVGDDAVMDRLDEETAIAVRLVAVRATPWLHAPERALPALAELASGRDPDLAPAAALAILRISETVDRRSLDAREDEGEEIRAALPLIAALRDDETARGDLRGAMTVALDRLEPLVASSGVAAPEAEAAE